MPTNTETYNLIFDSTLKEENSILISLDYMPVLDTRECLRRYPLDDPQAIEGLLEALGEYSSSKNFLEGNKQHYIDTPIFDQEEPLPGIWRVVGHRGNKNDEEEGIYQTLREGWATTLDEDEAIAGEPLGNHSDHHIVHNRIWRYIDPTVMADLIIEAESVDTITDPKIKGETITGSYGVSNVRGVISEDGTGTITQTLTYLHATAPEANARLVEWHYEPQEGLEGSIMLTREWANINPANAKAIADAWGETITDPQADGVTYTGVFRIRPFNIGSLDGTNTLRQVSVLSTADAFTLSYIENCDMSVSKTFYFDITQAIFLALGDAYDPAVDGVTVNISGGKNNNMLYDAVVTVSTKSKREYGPFLTTEDKFSENLEWQQKGITDDTDIRDISTRENGKIKRQNISVAADCSKDVTTNETEAKIDVEVRKTRSMSAFDTDTTLTAKNEAIREVEQTVHVVGKVKTTTSDENEFGLFDNSVNTKTAIPDANVRNTKSISAFDKDESVTARNEVVRETAQTVQSVGTIVQTSSDENEFGLFDNSVNTKTAISDTDVDNSRSVDEFNDKTTVTARNEATREPEITSVSGGVISSTRSSKNEFGEYDNSLSTDEALLQVDVQNSRTITKFDDNTTETARNEENRETAGVAVSGGIITSTQSSLNSHGKFDNSKNTKKAIADAEVKKSKTITAFDKDEGLTARNETVREVEETIQGDGTIVQTSSDKNEFGLFDNNKSTKTAISDAEVDKSKSISAFSTDKVITARNEDDRETEETAQTDGSIVTTKSGKNQFGKFDNSKSTKTATADAEVRKSKTITLTETDISTTAKNETVREVEDTVQAAGKIVTTSSDKNEFGLFDNNKSEKTATAISESTKATTKTAKKTQVVTRNEHQTIALPVPSLADGVIHRITNTKDQFGRYTTNDDQTDTVDNSISAYTSIKDIRYTSTKELFDGRVLPPVLESTDTYGSLTYTKGPDGRYYGTKIVKTYTSDVVADNPTDESGLQQTFIQDRYKTTATSRSEARIWTYTYSLDYYTTQSAARGSLDDSKGGPHMRARAWRYSSSLWCALTITAISSGAWSDVPTSGGTY
jgi:hypothetical protein